MSIDQQKRVLVVDDEPDLLFIVDEFLSNEGFLVDTACNGHEAADKLIKNEYDVLLTDMIMPNGSGEELIKALFVSKKFPKLKVIAMSGNILGDGFDPRHNTIEKMVDQCIVKPFDIAGFAKMLKIAMKEDL